VLPSPTLAVAGKSQLKTLKYLTLVTALINEAVTTASSVAFAQQGFQK
jgi:hypothetical protein